MTAAPAQDESSFNNLPEEILLQVFDSLDSKSLINASAVCTLWRRIADTPRLWFGLCCSTNRISGKYTERVARILNRKMTWKVLYFWLTSEDLRFQTAEAFKALLREMESDVKKKEYLLAKAIEFHPQSSTLCQLYADFLIERPDHDEAWDLAEFFYKKACEIVRANNTEGEKRFHAAFILFRYAYFLSRNRKRHEEANQYYLELFRLLPPNAWTIERYAGFLSEFRHQHTAAERVYQNLAHLTPTSSSLSSMAFFKWQIKRQLREASELFMRACDSDPKNIYFQVNFIARQLKDTQLCKSLLKNSRLLRNLETDRKDPDSIFSMALAYHQVPMREEAEQLYREHLQMTPKPNLYTLSNLAELLLHSAGKVKEAESLYRQALQRAGGHNETVEAALVALQLVKGEREEGLRLADALISSSYIQAAKNTLTEIAIVRYIHCYAHQKREALEFVKRMLVTEETRPKLILMFDANLSWARANQLPDYELMERITQVYNCEQFVEVLDDYPEWAAIEVPPSTPDQ
eukprot:TRINITY_DN10466_c0_g1_i1.p1 TRINITY_DN10466_c0_g1~~TRINITY_DN10466_c0_g1_i1.p1  ORF type:complete len:521 (+),score=85.98 TRINITY_DN10466_c0_g1_i1:336-1898(+)